MRCWVRVGSTKRTRRWVRAGSDSAITNDTESIVEVVVAAIAAKRMEEDFVRIIIIVVCLFDFYMLSMIVSLLGVVNDDDAKNNL